jgi:hypothetical protein
MSSYTFSPTTISNNKLISEQNSGKYNPIYQIVYDQQIKPHPKQPTDIYPNP